MARRFCLWAAQAQAVPDRRQIIAAIAEHADRPAPGAGLPGHHRSDAVCSRAWRGLSDSGRSASRHTLHAPNNCPRWRVTNRCCRRARANPAARSASSPRRLLAASHASVASTSCLIRSPFPESASATESRSAGRTGWFCYGLLSPGWMTFENLHDRGLLEVLRPIDGIAAVHAAADARIRAGVEKQVHHRCVATRSSEMQGSDISAVAGPEAVDVGAAVDQPFRRGCVIRWAIRGSAPPLDSSRPGLARSSWAAISRWPTASSAMRSMGPAVGGRWPRAALTNSADTIAEILSITPRSVSGELAYAATG